MSGRKNSKSLIRDGCSVLAKEIIEKYEDLIAHGSNSPPLAAGWFIDRQTAEKLKIYAYYQNSWKYKRRILSDNELQKHFDKSLSHRRGKYLSKFVLKETDRFIILMGRCEIW